MDCSLPASSVHGIFQARVLEWIAISFSRGSSRPRDWTPVSHIVDRRLIVWATKEVLHLIYFSKFKNVHDFYLGTRLGLCFFKYPILFLKITIEKKKLWTDL